MVSGEQTTAEAAADARRLILHFPAGPARRRLCIWGWAAWAMLLGGKVEIVAND